MARIWGLWLLVISVLLLVSNVQADDEDEPCTIRDGDQFFDLNPLKSKTDYTLKSVDGHDIYINVCQPATKETWALAVKEPDKVGGFTRREHGDFSLGYANTTLAVRDGSPTLTMVKGSPCPTHQHMHAATTIHFKCDTSAGIGEPVLIAQLPPPEDSSCYFFIEWKTNVACPTHMRRGSGGAWSVLNILASTIGGLFVLYVILGTLYNFLVLDLRGLDAIPRYSLVSLQDTIYFFRKWYARFANRGSSGGYLGNRRTNISSHYRGLADEEEGMLSGPPGFLDEQDDEDEEEHPPANGPAHGMDTNGVIRL